MEQRRLVAAGLLAGLAAGAGTYVVADWPELAVWNAVAFAAAIGLLVHAHDALWPYVDSWSEGTASRWHAASSVAIGLAVGTVVTALDVPLADAVAVGTFVGGVAVFAYATGIATALAYLRNAGELSR